MRPRLQSLLPLLWAIGSAAAQGYCIEQWACVERIEDQHGVQFAVYNAQPYPITVTLSVNMQELPMSDATPSAQEKTLSLDGFSRKTLFSFAPDSHKAPLANTAFHWTPGDWRAVPIKYPYQRPFQPTKNFPLIQGFGGRYSHQGASRYAVDFGMPVGTPVHAARGGIVIDLTEHHRRGGPSRRFSRYANFVTLLHNDGTLGEYYHLQHQGVVVERGDVVSTGQLLGYSGNTGFSSQPHLHFGVYVARSHGNYQSVPFSFVQ
ncbi:M23 family metallopeptidase [Aestuariibacter halophilus]|uniref:M23 family metallopeptidase n=1 Tax=Fluctibacter halophilus TaxID=226011 RepID=A0ABS8GBC8_9ALTE|nr:M23 family metallopeptidase [Aestuariibacter halophilus]MCC2617100.1 M23 family metallopeptidase [Aestuariibacter halophilus]